MDVYQHESKKSQGHRNDPSTRSAHNSTPSFRDVDLKIAVLGMGHVGLPTALGFAELGFDVTVADTDADKVNQVKAGTCPFYEPGMQELLDRHLQSGRLHPSSDIGGAISAATILFICVGTPQRESGEANLRDIESLARTIAINLNGYKLIVEKSTVPAITGDWIRRTVARYAVSSRSKAENGNVHRRLVDFDVASNPEFLQEGKALDGFFHPDRVVCGVSGERARELLTRLYEPLHCPILFTDVTTSELIKHAANAFLATKISFINMVAELCEAVGADVTKVAEGIGADRRIGADFLTAGIGFGGYCLPKDLRAFIHVTEQNKVDNSLLWATEQTNARCVERFLAKIRRALWITEGKTIGVLGLSFKAGTDDVREAPALKIVEALLKEGANLRLYDPKAMPEAAKVVQQDDRVIYCDDAYEAARNSDALLVLTDWPEFGELSLRRLRRLMNVAILIDGRNLYDPEQARQAGFEYFCMGRPSSRVPTTRSMTRSIISIRRPFKRVGELAVDTTGPLSNAG
jgi:UDPglucose 6-dehydrogenase